MFQINDTTFSQCFDRWRDFFFQEIVKEFLKILFGFPLERTYGKSQFSSSGGWGTDGSQPTR